MCSAALSSSNSNGRGFLSNVPSGSRGVCSYTSSCHAIGRVCDAFEFGRECVCLGGRIALAYRVGVRRDVRCRQISLGVLGRLADSQGARLR